MRLYSLRSFIFLGMALAASALVFAAPASAVPIDHGLYAVHTDAGKAVHDFHVAVISDQAQREAALFLNSDPVPIAGGKDGQRTPFDLRPKYAASYATDGLSFIDLRRRC
jgi:hypothetical protein